MKKQVEDFIRKQELFCRGDQILAAVSGGADSVCLLYLLAGMREDWELEVRVLHVNHGLRGEEAARDEAFAGKLCEYLSVPFEAVSVDVRGLADTPGLSEEEAARNLRYEALEKAAVRWEKESGRPVRIAVAHHGDDNVETILHNLFRGSGLKGLGGMRPKRGRIIRPLLCVSRQEILDYLEREGISYCRDSSNESEQYTRNRLRLQILPMIQTEVNERAAEHILQAAERMAQADEYLEAQARRWFEQYGADEEPVRSGADAARLAKEPPIIQTYVIRQMIGTLAGSRKDLTSIHVEGVRQLLDKQAGKQADLPYGLMARRTYDYLWIEKKLERKPELSRQISMPKAELQVFSREKGMKIPENQYTKWFDYDKIKGTLSVRTRRTGDYFLLPGGGRKTIKSYFIDEKVPSELRDEIPLLADGSHILWIIGRRISEGYKVTDETRTIMQVHISGGRENG